MTYGRWKTFLRVLKKLSHGSGAYPKIATYRNTSPKKGGCSKIQNATVICPLNSICQDSFRLERIQVGKKDCTCDFDFVVRDEIVDLTASNAICNRRCSGKVVWWELGGPVTRANLYKFAMRVRKGRVLLQWARVSLSKYRVIY